MKHRGTQRMPMTSRQLRPTGQRRNGTAATEMALVLPVLLGVVLGCVDFGRVSHTAMVLRGAVGVGANYAATHKPPLNDNSWKTRITNIITEDMTDISGFDATQLNVTISHEDISEITYITINATYPFEMLNDWPGLPGSVLLSHRVVVANYR